MKLLFFPMLTYTLFMAFKWKDKYPCILSAFFCGTLTGTLLIPVFFYAYTYLLGRDVFWLDLAVFVLSVLIAFRLSHRLTLSCRLRSYTLLLCSLICILAACFAVFSYHPPNLEIFEDMSSWSEINISPSDRSSDRQRGCFIPISIRPGHAPAPRRKLSLISIAYVTRFLWYSGISKSRPFHTLKLSFPDKIKNAITTGCPALSAFS